MTSPEQEARAATMASIRHSTELEGGRSSDAARAIQDLWIAGEIDTDELVGRSQVLHRLPPQPGDSHYPADAGDQDDELGTTCNTAVGSERRPGPPVTALASRHHTGDLNQERIGPTMSDLQIRRHSKAAYEHTIEAMHQINQAMASFAHMLDRFDELGIAYGDSGNAQQIAQLMDEITPKLRKAGDLVAAAPRGPYTADS